MELNLKMTLSKSTKGTHVYVDDREGAPVPTLYVKKDALPKTPPTTLQVRISKGDD